MAILLNDVWHSTVVDFGFVSSKIIWIKLKFTRVKVSVVVWYGPNEGDGEGRDRKKTMDSVGNGYRLYIIGNLNQWIGDRTGAFGVPGKNDNGRRVVEFLRRKGALCG